MPEKINCPERDSNPRHPDLMEGALTTELPRQPQWGESNISYKGTLTFPDISMSSSGPMSWVSTIYRSNSRSVRPGSEMSGKVNVPL